VFADGLILGTRSVCRKTDEFPVPATAALIGGFLVRPGKGMSLTERSQKGSSLISTSRRILGLLEQVLLGGFFPKMCNSVAFALHIY
jgi:hypothetical protein